MKHLFLISIFLLCLACFAKAGEITSVRQTSDTGAYLISKSYISSLEEYEAGRQGALMSMHKVFDVHYYDDFYANSEDIFYSDEFKYGGRYDLITYYWNPPVEYLHPFDTFTLERHIHPVRPVVPEPLIITILLCGIPILIRRTARSGN
jgi:hypothetical protein